MLSDDLAYALLEKYEKSLSKNVQSFIVWLSEHQIEDVRAILIKWDTLSKKEDARVRADIFSEINRYRFVVFTNQIIEKFGVKINADTILLKVIADVKQQRVYLVPPDAEHIAFAAKILDVTKADLWQHQEIAAHLVGAYIKLKDKKVESIAIGATTGLSLGLKVKYNAEDIDAAYSLVSDFVLKGKVPYEKIRFRKKFKEG